MTLPDFLVLRPLELSVVASLNAGTTALNFVIQNNQMSNWAWAAVAASVSAFYNPQTSWTQCQLANTELGLASCCSGSPSASCNQTSDLYDALWTTGSFQKDALGSTAFDNVEAAINAGTPMCVQITYTAGTTGYVCIFGYTETSDFGGILYIGDPVNGYVLINYSEFPEDYMGGGSWAMTYWTES